MCHLFLHFWESEKESLFQVSFQRGIILRLWDTISELERIQYRALYVSPEKPFVRHCNQYIYVCVCVTVPTSEEWLRIANVFNEICEMPNYIGSIDGKHRLVKRPPKAWFLCFNYKSFSSMKLLGWLMQTSASHWLL